VDLFVCLFGADFVQETAQELAALVCGGLGEGGDQAFRSGGNLRRGERRDALNGDIQFFEFHFDVRPLGLFLFERVQESRGPTGIGDGFGEIGDLAGEFGAFEGEFADALLTGGFGGGLIFEGELLMGGE